MSSRSKRCQWANSAVYIEESTGGVGVVTVPTLAVPMKKQVTPPREKHHKQTLVNPVMLRFLL